MRLITRLTFGSMGFIGRSLKILLLLPFITACGSSPSPSSSVQWPGKYDERIHAASKTFLPVPHILFGYELYKAQLYQESLLDPDARSPAGAEGIAQFMPATWNEVLAAMRLGYVERTNADVAIRAGAYYMAQLRGKWVSERTEENRMRWAQGSYNAGFGGVLAAQRRCEGTLEWSVVQACVPSETRIYVDRIWRHWKKWVML